MSRRRRGRGQGTLYKRDRQGTWIASWFDHTGKRKERSTRTTDKAAAERILAKRVADAALRREGVVDAAGDRFLGAERIALPDHLANWTESLTNNGRTKKHTTTVTVRASKTCRSIQAERLSDLRQSLVKSALADMQKGGLSLQTCQHYLRAIKQFSRWLFREGLTKQDQLAHLEGYNTATDRRYERRPLLAEEVEWLVSTTEQHALYRGMSGIDRAVLYRVAVGTGFRVAELRSLRKRSFRLDEDPPAIELAARDSKRRRADFQPIRRDLGTQLASWLAQFHGDDLVFTSMPEKTARMVRADLRHARARWIRSGTDRADRRRRSATDFLRDVDGSGRVVDFHCLRATYVTLLVKGGASAKVTQDLARHSDPKLTLNTYTQLGIHDLARALEALPSCSPNDTGIQTRLRATGTDDSAVDPQLMHQQLGRVAMPSRAVGCDDREARQDGDGDHKPLENKTLCDTRRHPTTRDETATERTRTVDLRFTKPLLYQLSYGGDPFTLAFSFAYARVANC